MRYGVACLMLLVHCGGRGGSGESKKEPVHVSKPAVSAQLTVHSTQKDVFADLSFTNHDSEARFVEKVNACIDGVIENNVFRISSAGRPITYTGMLAKRTEPSPNDLYRLEPEKTFTTRVKLTNAYE